MVAEVNFNKDNTILTGDGLLDAVGEQIQYSYIVENEGDDFLDELRLTDSLLGFNNLDVIAAIAAGQLDVAGDTDADLELDPGETWTITEGAVAGVDLTYTVTQEDFDSNGTAEDTGTDPDIPGRIDNYADLLGLQDEEVQTVSQESSAAVLTLLPAIDIEKATNGEDADDPTGPNIAVGDPVTWTYEVTNTGNVALFDVVVTDDNGTPLDLTDDFAPDPVDEDGDGSIAGDDPDDNDNTVLGDGILQVGETWLYTATATAEEGQYENFATVSAFDPADTEVTDDDPSHYFGIDPSIDIEKHTNGDDADDPTGPNILVGETVTWTYSVFNDGNVALFDVVVTDDNGTPLDLTDDFAPDPVDEDGDGSIAGDDPDDNDNTVLGDGILQVGETWLYTATSTAEAGQYANIADVTADDPLDDEVTDNDPSHYFGVDPDIDIVKTGAFNDESGDGFAQPGETITYNYSVTTGTGNVAIANVVVIDDAGTPLDLTDDFLPTFFGGDTDLDGLLDTDETWLYTANVAIDQDDIDAGGITNIACVTGEDVLLATMVEDCDPETVPLIPPPPDEPGSANTPGFWKNHDTIFNQELFILLGDDAFDQLYEDVFGVTLLFDGFGKHEKYPEDPTLGEALAAKGGGEGALLRASTAAFVNAASDDTNFNFSDPAVQDALDLLGVLDTLNLIDDNGDEEIDSDEVINAVQDVYSDGGAVPILGTDNFDLEDTGDVASAFDALNNVLPSVDTMDFAPSLPSFYEGTIADGDTVTDSIDELSSHTEPDPTLSDYWAFFANAGDSVTLSGARLEGEMDMSFWVFEGIVTDPATQFGGSLDAGDPGYVDDGDDELPANLAGPFGDPQSIFVAPSTGVYTVIVTDFASAAETGGDGMFDYELDLLVA